jgi:hypothetical protein
VSGIHEACGPGQHFYAIARKLRLGDIDFGFDDVLHPEREIRHVDLFLHAVIDAVNVLVIEAGKVQHGLAHGLAGNGTCIDAGAAHHFALLH